MHSLPPIAGITCVSGSSSTPKRVAVEGRDRLAELRPAPVRRVLVGARVAHRPLHRLDDVAEESACRDRRCRARSRRRPRPSSRRSCARARRTGRAGCARGARPASSTRAPASATNSSENSPLKTGSAQPVSVTSRSSADVDLELAAVQLDGHRAARAAQHGGHRRAGCARSRRTASPPPRARRCAPARGHRRRPGRTTRWCGSGNSSLCSIWGPIARQVQLLEPLADADRALRVADAHVLEGELAAVRRSPCRGRRRPPEGKSGERRLRAPHLDRAGARRT